MDNDKMIPTDPRMRNVMYNYDHNALGLDDTFQFKCRECGRCCKNRTDIILTPRDLYNIAKYLGRTIEEVVKRYCEVYIGDSSRIPVVRLKPAGPEKTCPLLWEKKCKVHGAKPVVCALFPLGRASSSPSDGQDSETPPEIQPRYFMQPATCGSQVHTHTVRSWLEKFGIPVEDEFYVLWTQTILFLRKYFNGLEDRKASEYMLTPLWNATFTTLYIDFDTELEFMPQFRDCVMKLKDALISLKATTERLLGGGKDGE
jgi:Fe-S-cluster containining protein